MPHGPLVAGPVGHVRRAGEGPLSKLRRDAGELVGAPRDETDAVAVFGERVRDR